MIAIAVGRRYDCTFFVGHSLILPSAEPARRFGYIDRMSDRFEIGQRVRIVRHFEFADGIIGTIAQPIPGIVGLSPGEWQGHIRTMPSLKGPMVCYYVHFDEPADDGSGDGPYLGVVIDDEYLEPLSA